jgi:hypothetical protein
MRVAGLLLAAALPLGAQTSGTAFVTGPPGNPLHEGTPGFVITTSGFAPSEIPLRITLQIATQADFGGPLLADTTVSGVTSSSTTIVVPHLLPERISIWWRARVVTAAGQLVLSNVDGPRTTATWLTLISPNNRNGSTVDTKRPTFLWSSATIRPPVRPWTYQIVISQSLDGAVVLSSPVSDTVFTSFVELESNTPYLWSVTAKLATGDSIRVQSFKTFVILDPNAPVATVLYRPFPNPFPNERVAATCIWFDLRAQPGNAPVDVKLDILDMRGNHVARIVPGRGLGPLPPSRYGRAQVGSASGCDDRFTWDGRDDNGRYVPMGVYLIRFQGDRAILTQKVLWRGR